MTIQTSRFARSQTLQTKCLRHPRFLIVEGMMTRRAKYLYAYIAGSVFWAGVFYLAAYCAAHWTFWRVLVSYLIFEAWIGMTEFALYRADLIPAYCLRLRRMFLILGCSIGAPVAGINGWALYDSTAPLRTVALGIIIALAVVAGCMWLAFKSAVKLRLGIRPDDIGREREGK